MAPASLPPNSYTSFERLNEEFEAIKFLEQGAHGHVLLGTHKFGKEKFAVKVVKLSKDGDGNVTPSREILCTKKLNPHPHVVLYSGSWTEEFFSEFYAFIQMEHCPGGSLRDAIKTQKIQNVEQGHELLQGILEGLKYVHAQNIIHRDVKPENILLTTNLVPKISDFGMVADGDVISHTYGPGTAIYMAPEIFGRHYTTKIDIYSLGIVAYEIFLCLTCIDEREHVRITFSFSKNVNRFAPPFGVRMKPHELQTVKSLIEAMVFDEPERRPSASQLLDEQFYPKKLLQKKAERLGKERTFLERLQIWKHILNLNMKLSNEERSWALNATLAIDDLYSREEKESFSEEEIVDHSELAISVIDSLVQNETLVEAIPNYLIQRWNNDVELFKKGKGPGSWENFKVLYTTKTREVYSRFLSTHPKKIKEMLDYINMLKNNEKMSLEELQRFKEAEAAREDFERINVNLEGGSSAASNDDERIRVIPTMVNAEFTLWWKQLEKAIEEIQRKNHSDLSFGDLYRYAYYMVLHKYSEEAYKRVRDVVKNHLTTNVRERVKAAMNSRFLKIINVEWTDHVTAMGMIREIFMYLEDAYVKTNNLEPICNAGVPIFRDVVVRHETVAQHLSLALVSTINQDRRGDVVDRTVIKAVCSLLLTLDSTRSVYEELFERPFLEDTARFYRLEGQKFIAQNSTSLFVRKVKRCLELETERANRFLEEKTTEKLLKVLEQVLIVLNMQTVMTMESGGVAALLKEEKRADLSDLYSLLKKVEGGLELMASTINTFLKDQGKKQTDENPVEYIRNVMSLKERFDCYLVESFKDNTLFKQKIQAGFEFFLNSNPKSAEFLCLFIDGLLRKNTRNLTDEERESLQKKAMVLFRFLREKDVFEKFYKHLLAKRLLLNKSSSDEAEKQFISLLRTECGFQFTSKLEGMFKDMELSMDLNAAYRSYCSEFNICDPVEINVSVLTTGRWPTQVVPACHLPAIPRAAFENFENFYQQKHRGRKLLLNCALGMADVNAIFYGVPVNSEQNENEAGPSTALHRVKTNRVERKILQVSTHQMIVLLCFNERPRWSFAELLEATQIRREYLTPALQSLAMASTMQRILIRRGEGRDLKDNDEFQVNDAFTSKFIKVKVQQVAARIETKAEIRDTRAKVEEDRRYEIDATIVRIMKARKKLEHNNLIAEVITQLKSRFQPNAKIIKCRVETLIENDYLTRDSENPKVYEYVA